MGKRTKAHTAGDVLALSEASPAVRNVKADLAPVKLVNLVSSCCRAILKGDVVLSPDQRDSLRPYEKDLREAASPETSRNTKKAILKRRRFLQALVRSQNRA